MSTGAPPIVLLPGTLLDQRSLGAATEGLASQTLLLGEADTLEAELDRLAAATSAPALWIGHSLGGIVALHLAARHPQVVRGLLLLAANARGGASTNAARRSAQWTMACEQGLRVLASDKLGAGYGLAAGDETLLAALADQAEAVGLARFGRQLHYAATRPGLFAATRPGLPVLALSGSADTLCPPVQSDEIVALVPAARHLSLAGGTHLFPMQQPGWVRQQLDRFLATLHDA